MKTKPIITFANLPIDIIEKWQGIADLLARIISVPAALIMKTEDEYMEVLVSNKTDNNNPYHSGDKEKWHGLYCETVIKTQKELSIPDATADPHWSKNPDIKLGMIAYLGYPINFPDNRPFGTLCVLDNKKHAFSTLHKQLLLQLRDTIQLDIKVLQEHATAVSAHDSLRKNKEWLDETTRIAHVGGWAIDLVGNTLEWTEETFRIHELPFGGPPDVAKAIEFYHPEDRPQVAAVVQRAMESGENFDLTARIITAKKNLLWVRAIGHAVFCESQLVAVRGTVQDITRHKRLEEELQNVQKIESIVVLAGGIAHDFNNLMGGIFGYIDMASEASTENKVTSYLSKAMNTIDRARALTLQLLTFAKGGAPIQEICHLFPFVRETAEFALSGANVSCNFDVPQDLWTCNFDKNQIGQVIDNIIINAQQAMPDGGMIELSARNITLEKKEHSLLANGNYVRISIKDTGIGISNELITRIFDPFFTTKAMGHGLGLSTCYSIIKRHGGCIDVESEPGKGSTFHVYLPASMEAASSEKQQAAKTHEGSGTFLIMDDEEVMRDTIGGMLESLGYSVESKENGKDAIDFFLSETKANRKIVGMIIDLTIPGGMGGKAAIEEIRKLNTEIPVFVVSGYADDPVMKKPSEHGFTASLCKPFRKAELSEMLSRYL